MVDADNLSVANKNNITIMEKMVIFMLVIPPLEVLLLC